MEEIYNLPWVDMLGAPVGSYVANVNNVIVLELKTGTMRCWLRSTLENGGFYFTRITLSANDLIRLRQIVRQHFFVDMLALSPVILLVERQGQHVVLDAKHQRLIPM